MNLGLNRIRAVAGTRWLRWLAAPAAVLAITGAVIGAGSLPPLVDLAAEPLYARGVRAKPTLTLALSVEFPTVGAQYVDVPNTSEDGSYTPTKEYIGYFNPTACYQYVDNPTETRVAGMSLADYKRFERIGDADAVASVSLRTCGGRGFSGNFMNWVGSSAIDILRLGLSGGDRVVDTSVTTGAVTSGFTILQRAYLPTSFWNSRNFPSKKLLAALARDAVPDGLLKTTTGATWTGNVYVASCGNRLYFGTTATGNCSSPGDNANLGVKLVVVPANGSYNGTLPGDFVQVVSENGTFNLAAGVTKQVAYGANTSWAIKTLSGPATISCNNATFGDPIVGTAKTCRTRDPVSATGPGITADGFMFARVRVCESDAAGLLDRRESMCLRYPNGAFKPVGELQKYSDLVRVAAFGYLNDSTGNPNERYGGVLRSPMKYVGPKLFDENFSLSSTSNPKREWDETTGEFRVDPDGVKTVQTGVSNSGVINYLNQFGRSGTPGNYKTYDPVGELYYEALRYLQGLPPTPDATTGMTDTMKDGFPAYTAWTDPHPPVANFTSADAYSCVRNSIVAIGDVNTHQDKQIPGNSRTSGGNDKARGASLAANEPDFHEWTKVVGKFESGSVYSYKDGKGVTRQTSNFNPPISGLNGMEEVNIGADQAAYYMAGMAYWANTHDIRGADWTVNASDANGVSKQRPGMRVRTYVLDVNEYGQQTAQSAHRINQFFLASKYGGFDDTTGTGNPFKVKTPSSPASAPIYENSNANWESATIPGDAQNYYLSSSAQGVLDALHEIFDNIAKQANSIAGGAISTQRLNAIENYIYQAQFDPADWSGDVVAIPVSANASGIVTIGGTSSSTWTSVAAVLANRAVETRKIYVGPGGSTGSAHEFVWSGSMPSYVKEAMKTPPGSSVASDSDAMAEDRLNYLRGERKLETNPATFRKRGKVMGDIVNSGIAYSGAPSTKFNGSSFGDYYAANKDRKKALFVGANDGMLHAFDAGTGEELFAYIPSWIVPKLPKLTSPGYIHESFVDGTPEVVEAKVGNDWKAVLVAGTGGGGQGVFALDVSNPDPAAANGFNADKVMWEFTDADDVDLGNVIGRPKILSFRTTSGGTPKYFAVIASGVNNHANDGHASSTGANALFLLDLSKSRTDRWVLGSNYHKLVFPAPLTTIANGMLNFSYRLDYQGNVAYIYAGDLQGNLWKLDFAKANLSDTGYWSVAKLSSYMADATPVPLFIADDGAATPRRQPISMEPTLLFGSEGNIIATFGTGKFLEVSDTTSSTFTTQSIYAVLDDGTAVLDNNASAIGGRSKLQHGVVSAGVITVAAFVWGRPVGTDLTVRSGWYFDLPDVNRGERQVSGFAAFDGKVTFGSVIPALNSCDDGSGNLYVIDVLSGNGISTPSTVGIYGEPMVIAVDDAELVDLTKSDSTGRRVQRTRRQVVVQGSAGVDAPKDQWEIESRWVGRLSWRELSNYQELRKP